MPEQATRWLSWYGVGLASADRLPVVVRIPAGPLGSLKCDPPKGNGRRPQKKVNVMPERLLSVISGILAGGIPGFRLSCVAFHPLTWPLFVFLCFLCFASFSVAILIMTHKMSSCMLFPLLVAIPPLCVLFGLVWLWLCVFLFVCFFFGLV